MKARAESAHGSVRRRKRWISRGESSAGRSAASNVPASLRSSLEIGRARSRSRKTRDQDVAGRVRRIGPLEAGHGTAQRPEQAELVGTAKAVRRQALELAENPLAGRLSHPGRGCAHELLGRLVEPEVELVLQADGTQEAKRIVGEHRRPDGPEPAFPQIGRPVEGIDERPAVKRARERVHREVARGEVFLDARSVQRGEVDGVSVAERDPPGPVALGEREDSTVRQARVATRGRLGVRARNVDVHDLAAAELVAQRAPDHPGRRVADGLTNPLIHRRSSARPGWNRHLRRR